MLLFRPKPLTYLSIGRNHTAQVIAKTCLARGLHGRDTEDTDSGPERRASGLSAMERYTRSDAFG